MTTLHIAMVIVVRNIKPCSRYRWFLLVTSIQLVKTHTKVYQMMCVPYYSVLWHFLPVVQ
jgi:hypothetical protein